MCRSDMMRGPHKVALNAKNRLRRLIEVSRLQPNAVLIEYVPGQCREEFESVEESSLLLNDAMDRDRTEVKAQSTHGEAPRRR